MVGIFLFVNLIPNHMIYLCQNFLSNLDNEPYFKHHLIIELIYKLGNIFFIS